MSDPSARFAALVRRPDDEIPLDEAALVIAAHAYPGLDVDAQVARLDQIAAGCPSPSLEDLRHHLFDVLGFAGNVRRYADPRNSFLNDVLDRRVGIPISLAVVAMEVGRRVGVALRGVGMPGHFLVRHETEAPVLLDPFNGGRALDAGECEQLFHSVHGPGAVFAPSLLAPVSTRAILARMLANLHQVYLLAGDVRSTGWGLRLRVTIPATTPGEMAERAGDLAAIGRFPEAAATLEELADVLEEETADRARVRAASLRARLN